MRAKGKSSHLRKGRVSQAYESYSITKVVEHRRPVLANPSLARVLLNSWGFLRGQERIKLFAFCVMPDHYHLLFCLMPGEDLSDVLESTNKFTSGKINKVLNRKGRFWQNGFRDHCCRDEDDLHDSCEYIEHNPLRAGLVSHPAEWPYSSAHPNNQYLLDREWWP